MIEKFIPDMYQKSIYTIDYKKLKKYKILLQFQLHKLEMLLILEEENNGEKKMERGLSPH